MELTQEQSEIINSSGNIKINAVAGSGKTTTVIEYAKARPKESKILYLAFNKSVKTEAIKKFFDKGLLNVTVETAHSLAFHHIVKRSNYKVRSQSYKTYEIVELLGLKGNEEKHTEYIIANHINKFITYFCNSDKQKVQDLNYLDTITDNKARAFVTTYYKYIEGQTRLLLSKMDKGEIEIIHDFYLKKFQLLSPELYFDYILFDEGQDASPAMLDVFFKQRATKVIVGDTHQQIYGWRHAVNSLEKAEFKTYHLSTSFRFSQDIANLAIEVLKWKNHLVKHQPFIITGRGTTKENKVKAILARTNLGLLLKAIEYMREKKNIKHIYFEGNINSYTYAEDGASLYDVLNLYNYDHHLIRDKLIKAMKDFYELEDYIEKTEDIQLGLMVEIVKEYGNEIYDIIKDIKAKHVGTGEKEKAEMIFSTVHRSKGMEYDSVQIVNDFLTEEKLKQLKEETNEPLNISKLNEEINLLYVAVTRTRNNIHIPEALLPEKAPVSTQIHVLNVETAQQRREKEFAKIKKPAIQRTGFNNTKKEKAFPVEQFTEKRKASYKPWTKEMDDELTVMFCEGVDESEMAKHFERTKGAISLRIKKLELYETYG
jgi:F-box protein 18 (helicase)